MPALILGKTLLSDDELIEFAFSEQNTLGHNLNHLRIEANESAIRTSLCLIQIMRADRIYIQTSRKRNSQTNKDPL